jgi:hypothetical protein
VWIFCLDGRYDPSEDEESDLERPNFFDSFFFEEQNREESDFDEEDYE